MSRRGLHGRALAVAAALAALLGLAGAGTATAATSRLVYTDFFNGQIDLFTVRSDGTRRHQLTDGRAFEQSPSWSPKRKRIVFGKTNNAPGHLFTMRANGSHVRRVPHSKFAGEPSWSPNGRKLAFTIERANFKRAVFTMRLDGTHRKRLTAWSTRIASPDWAPTSRAIVYVGPHGIVRMRADGRRKHLVTHTGEGPAWSPDGKRIAYYAKASNRAAVSDVYTIRIDGTHRVNLTGSRPAAPCPDFPDECRREDEFPTWSPNGKRVAFDETSSGNGDAGIFSVKTGGSSTRRITRSGEGADW